MASFRCYDNSDVIATLIITNFHLYLIQLWWQFFQMFVYGDVVYAQTWQVLTLKNCIELLSYASTGMLSHRMALVSFRLFCKNLGNLQEFSTQMRNIRARKFSTSFSNQTCHSIVSDGLKSFVPGLRKMVY